MQVQIKRLRDNGLAIPQYKTVGAAGFDIQADLSINANVHFENWSAYFREQSFKQGLYVLPHERLMIDTGFAYAIPEGFEGQMRPRSGVASRDGITLSNSPGTVDSDYRGEVRLLLINNSGKSFLIQHGDRLAQMVIAPIVQVELVETLTLGQTLRGEQGYGSTGKQ